MNDIILSQNDSKTMSSKEIAIRTGKRHPDVIRITGLVNKQRGNAA